MRLDCMAAACLAACVVTQVPKSPPLEHRCVLEALSTIPLPETGDNLGGRTVPPSGLTSLLTLSW